MVRWVRHDPGSPPRYPANFHDDVSHLPIPNRTVSSTRWSEARAAVDQTHQGWSGARLDV